MASLRTPLSPGAIAMYHQYIVDTIIAGDPADQAAVATAIETYDESATVQKERWRQLKKSLQEDFGKNMANGELTALAVSARGSSYAVGDQINVTTSTGSGAVGQVTGTKGYASEVAINAAGTGYTAEDVVTVTLANGTGLTVEVTTVGGSGEATSLTIVTDGTGLTSNETGAAVTGGTGNDDLTIDVTVALAGIDTVEVNFAGHDYATTDTATTITTTSGTGGTVTATIAKNFSAWVSGALDALIAA